MMLLQAGRKGREEIGYGSRVLKSMVLADFQSAICNGGNLQSQGHPNSTGLPPKLHQVATRKPPFYHRNTTGFAMPGRAEGCLICRFIKAL